MRPLASVDRETGRTFLSFARCRLFQFSSSFRGDGQDRGSTPGQAFEDLIGDIEKGLVRALVVVESDPFHCYPDRLRLDRAMSKLELLIAIDYFPTMTVNRASVFYPASTIFETGSTYINQEGRVQFAQRVHSRRRTNLGRRTPAASLRGYCSRRRSPAGVEGAVGNRRPGWQDTGPNDISPGDFIPAEHTSFEVFKDGNYPVDGVRILPGKSGSRWNSRSGPEQTSRDVEFEEKPGSSDGLELLTVEWMFGTTEFSAWSDSLFASLTEPYMSMHSKDARSAGLSDGDRVSLELDNGSVEIRVSVSDRTAEGVLVIPRHQSLDWRKMKDFRVRVLPEKIRKI